ncbi:peptidase M16 [Mangrovactinospora gilvigrisea]|uniref:Peptidase M16 n=2 Tax=Mangrovactinospora gilvigrisea TaxID=1428644 RepID=A0A1J7C3S2_9ACTN|nr:peptidase M16 [Mangrovactinospora gilvigrisea]
MTLHPRPEAAEPRPWVFPAPERSVLGNGLTVLRCHRPGRHVVAVELSVDAPLHAEPEGLDGVATLTARALAEGTARMDGEEFAAALERCGATLDAQADHPGIRVSLEVPASRLEQALELVAEAVRAPAFPDAEIERLVANRLDEITHELANPQRRAAMALYAELFPAADRVSRPRQGTAETVRRIDRDAVAAFHAEHFRPATACAVIAGDLSEADLDGVLERTLGAWGGTPAEHSRLAPVASDDAARVVIVDRPGSVQTQVLIGRTGPDRHDPTWAEQVVGIYCLGGTLTSRLDRVLREEKGYTYGIRAFPQVVRSGEGGDGRGALLGIAGSVQTEVTGAALGDLVAVIRGVADGGLTADERNAAVQNLVGVAPLKYETAAAVADTLADQVEQGLPDDYQAHQYQRLAKVTAEAATAAATAAFPLDRMVVVLVGDASRIGDEVRKLGIGPVTVQS